MYSKNNRKPIVLILFMLCGLVVGGFIGEYAGNLQYLDWLSYGQSFGLDNPLSLDLGIITLQFALTVKFNIAGVIGVLLFIFIYKRVI